MLRDFEREKRKRSKRDAGNSIIDERIEVDWTQQFFLTEEFIANKSIVARSE